MGKKEKKKTWPNAEVGMLLEPSKYVLSSLFLYQFRANAPKYYLFQMFKY